MTGTSRVYIASSYCPDLAARPSWPQATPTFLASSRDCDARPCPAWIRCDAVDYLCHCGDDEGKGVKRSASRCPEATRLWCQISRNWTITLLTGHKVLRQKRKDADTVPQIRVSCRLPAKELSCTHREARNDTRRACSCGETRRL